MAPKAEARPDAALGRYLCPQCFTEHYQNDVFFAASRPSLRRDARRDFRRACLRGGADGAGEGPVLLDWRSLPEARRHWEGGAVTAVQDIDGSWTGRRVCPCCHQPLPPPCPVVFGWRGETMDGGAASELFEAAAQAAPERWGFQRPQEGLALGYGYLTAPNGARALCVPDGLERAAGAFGQNCRRRCCTLAAGAVVRLALGRRANGALDDLSAFQTLDALLKDCGYTGIALKPPVVFWLEGLEEEPDPLGVFAREGGQLERRVAYSFGSRLIAAAGADAGREALRAAQWLAEQVRAVS